MQGNTLYEKNPDKQLYPASMTKVMTALVAVENGNLGGYGLQLASWKGAMRRGVSSHI
ncbi:MAG: hypothetical protein ACLR23_02585 [Clostridia bacterium]